MLRGVIPEGCCKAPYPGSQQASALETIPDDASSISRMTPRSEASSGFDIAPLVLHDPG
jgi:hypothetical protein